MKQQQITGLLFSALLLSTFAHEFYYRSLDQKSHHGLQSRNKASLLGYRDKSGEGNCELRCEGDPSVKGNSSLTVIVNVTTSVIVVVNETAHVAWAMDTNSGLVAVFNATSGNIVIWDIKTGLGVYIKGKGSSDIHVLIRTSLEELYKSASSEHGGIYFNKSNVTEEILVVIGGVLISMSEEYSIQFKYSMKGSLTVLIEISKRMVVLFRDGGKLEGFFQLTTTTTYTIKIRYDLIRLVGVFEGIGEAVELSGGIKILIERKVTFNLTVILNPAISAEGFFHIITQISAKLGAEGLKRFFGSIEILLRLMAKLSGGSNRFAAFLNVVVTLIQVLRSKDTSNVELLIGYLIAYSTSKDDGGSVEKEWKATLDLLIEFVSKLNKNGAYSDLLKDLKALRDGKLEINGVKIYAIILVLLKVGSVAALELVVRVLVLIVAVVAIEISMVVLLLVLIRELDTAFGIWLLKLLVPGIDIDEKILASGSGNLLVVIFKNIDIKLILNILQGKISDDESSSAVFIVIYKAISATLKLVSGGKYKLRDCLVSDKVAKLIGELVALLTNACGGGNGSESDDGVLGGEDDNNDGDHNDGEDDNNDGDHNDGEHDSDGEHDDDDDDDNGDHHSKHRHHKHHGHHGHHDHHHDNHHGENDENRIHFGVDAKRHDTKGLKKDRSHERHLHGKGKSHHQYIHEKHQSNQERHHEKKH